MIILLTYFSDKTSKNNYKINNPELKNTKLVKCRHPETQCVLTESFLLKICLNQLL